MYHFVSSRIICVLLVLALGSAGCGTDDPEPTLADALENIVAAGVPGAVAMVTGPDGTETAVAGLANPETGAPLRFQDAMPIGGLTTSYVAAVALELEAEGTISLGDAVEDFLPGRFSYGWDVAIYDLLQHTSGIPEYVDVGDAPGLVIASCLASDRCHWTPGELTGLVDQDPPAFGPGEGWGYSNTNFVVAGEILEQVTGRPWSALVTEHLLEPLHLSSTRFGTDDASLAVVGHTDLDEDGELDPVAQFIAGGSGPEGALIANAADVMGFFRPLLQGELLSDASQLALTATAPTSFGHEDYGLGISYTFGFAEPQVGNTGEALGFSAFVEHNRDTDVTTVILLTQSGDLPTEEWGQLLRLATDVAGRAVLPRAAESGPGQLRLYCTLDPTLLGTS